MFKKPRNFKEEEIFDKFFCGKRFFSFSIYCKTWIVPKMVPETGLEPVQEVIPRDFKSLASTNSATPAEINWKWRHLPDSNRRWRFCRPLPYLLAKVPTKEFRLKKDIKKWSGKRDSDPRRLPWQGSTLPLSYSRSGTRQDSQKLLNVKFFLSFLMQI